jgi:hypothetical protein
MLALPQGWREARFLLRKLLAPVITRRRRRMFEE